MDRRDLDVPMVFLFSQQSPGAVRLNVLTPIETQARHVPAADTDCVRLTSASSAFDNATARHSTSTSTCHDTSTMNTSQ